MSRSRTAVGIDVEVRRLFTPTSIEITLPRAAMGATSMELRFGAWRVSATASDAEEMSMAIAAARTQLSERLDRPISPIPVRDPSREQYRPPHRNLNPCAPRMSQLTEEDRRERI